MSVDEDAAMLETRLVHEYWTSSTPRECTTPTPRQRTNSGMSDPSDNSEIKSAVIADDSGNYSTSSNTSEFICPFEAELHNHCQHAHTLLRERDQSLNLAMQDVRKLRSELERLNKSEEWYKKELRSQKSTRLEALERLYTQERKYMQENQRLQRECMRLYDKCGEMEKELQSRQDAALLKLVENEEQQQVEGEPNDMGSIFELEQQRLLIDDQQKLINVLRKQKHALLEDLSRLNEERDAKVMELQETLAGVEVENTHMTAQCKRLLIERQTLEDTLKNKDATLVAENAEKLKMRIQIEELKQKSYAQEQMLAHKEREIDAIQQNFKHNMKNETNMDEVHRLSMSYHEEINAKTAEISSLKKSLQAMQNEMDALAELQAQNDKQGRQIEQLNLTLEAQQCELTNLQETDEDKTQQITELQRDLAKIRAQHADTLDNLHAAQMNLRSAKQELIVLHEQYANMCALCERTRFELELLEIEKGKLKFQADSDRREVELMRVKLAGYMKHTEELGAKINELEYKLNSSKIEKEVLELELRKLENQAALENTKPEEIEGCFEQNKVDTELFQKLAPAQKEDDSGFLDATKYSSNEDEITSELTDATNELLKHLNSQKAVLKERREIVDAFQKAACYETPLVEEHKDPSLNDDAAEENELSERQKQLMEYINDQSQLTVERRQLLEAFESLINKEVGCQETSINIQNILTNKNLTEESKKQRSLNTLNHPTELDTLRQELGERNLKFFKLEERLKTQCEELQNLQRKLLECDERYVQSSREQEQTHRTQVLKYEDAIQILQAENERLVKELQNIFEAKSDIESMLEKQKQLILELRAKIAEVESRAANLNDPQPLHSADQEELQILRNKVDELEERLQAAKQGNEERRNERIRLIRKLLEQQNSKVKQLNESQEEWEELLAALHTAQAMEENTRAQLQLKHAELDELNELFAEQNEELRLLQEKVILGDFKASLGADDERGSSKFQQKVTELQLKLSTQLADSEAQQRKIEELQDINERLERQLNEDYANEVAKNQQELRALQAKMDSIQVERNSYATRLAEMEKEMQQFKKRKREALLLPPEFLVLPVTSSAASTTAETSSSSCDENACLGASDSDNNDRMRILTKVLEAEYRRKMKRYDMHIHTLLSNIKKLKKSLRNAEQRAANLTLEQSRTQEEFHSLQMTKRQLEEMRLKCEQNQNTIKALENALEIERKKFEASDLGKAVCIRSAPGETLQRDEPTHEVANLIDDYKKLIKQSALATQGPKTSAILDLIQRSNQCVPNLHKLETTIDGLRGDLEYFLSSNILNVRHQQSVTKLEGPSLLDELRAATESC